MFNNVLVNLCGCLFRKNDFRLLLMSGLMVGGMVVVALSGCAQANRPAARPGQDAVAVNIADTPQPTQTRSATGLPKPGPTPTIPVWPTLVPTVDPTALPARLQTAFTVNQQSGTNGYNLRRVSGWKAGLLPSDYCQGPYHWLDNSHLMLQPITGEIEAMGKAIFSQPVVVNLLNGSSWVPPTENSADCQDSTWSNALQLLVATQNQTIVLFDPDGQVVRSFPGEGPLHLSPSGRRLLAGFVWRDLETDQMVDFSGQHKSTMTHPAWSSDETKLFDCCFGFADTHSNQYSFYWLDPLNSVGRGGSPGFFTGPRSNWVLSGTHVLVEGDFIEDNQPGILPLLDPATKTYRDVRILARLPLDWQCGGPRVAPDGKHIWLSCWQFDDDQVTTLQTASFIINLNTFAAHPINGEFQFIDWSPDSRFGLLARNLEWDTQQGDYRLISATDGDLRPLAPNRIIAPIWSPQGERLAYLSQDGRTLTSLDVKSGRANHIPLPQPAHHLVWNPRGDQLAIEANDGTLLWMADLTTGLPIPLTPPLPGARSVSWSPDGQQVAFVSDTDLYIVSTQATTTSNAAPVQASPGIATYTDPELGFTFDIPADWAVDSFPGELAHFYRSDGTGSILAYSVFGPEVITPTMLLDEAYRGEWSVSNIKPVRLGEFEAARLELAPGEDRPAVAWAIITPSGRGVKFAPAGDLALVEKALATLRALPVEEPFVLPTPTLEPPALDPFLSPLPTPTPLPGSPTPEPLAPPPGLIYQADGWYWLVGSDGQPTRLLDKPYAVFAKDLDYALYDEGGDIWLADLRNNERRNLTQTSDRMECCAQWWPATQPDQILALSWPREEEMFIVPNGFLTILNSSGQEYRFLDETRRSYGFVPSPDGQTVMSLEGETNWFYASNGEAIPFDPSPYKLTTPAEFGLTSPAWSPDGKHLSWATGSYMAGELWFGFAVTDLEMKTIWFAHPYQPTGFDGFPPGAVWSPDGQWLAFWVPAEIYTKAGVWVISADGQTEFTIGTADEGIWIPSRTLIWSPDSHWLAFNAEGVFWAEPGPWLVETGRWYRRQLALPPGARIADWKMVK